MKRGSIVWLAALLALSGCGKLSGFGGQGFGQLYVSSSTGNKILRYDAATATDGDITPAAEISGSATTLSNPRFLYVDSTNDVLYVANYGANSILAFSRPISASGNVTPARTISGASTTLSSPVDITIDSARNVMYVSNSGSNVITAYSSATTANGDVAPVRTISSATPFSNPHGLYYDSASDRLYVADSGSNAIQVFNNISTASGAVTPARTISGSNTLLSGPASVRVDGGSNLFVANSTSSSICVFANSATVTGNTAPSRCIQGSSTLMSGPYQLLYDDFTDEAYSANPGGGRVLVFRRLSDSATTGNLVPNRALSGATAGAIGVAADFSR